MTKIYESPDKGETVYQRDFQDLRREIVKRKMDDLQVELLEDQLWKDIRQSAETNLTLHRALERVKILYRLSKDNPR